MAMLNNQRVIIRDLLKSTHFHGILWIFPEEIMGSNQIHWDFNTSSNPWGDIWDRLEIPTWPGYKRIVQHGLFKDMNKNTNIH